MNLASTLVELVSAASRYQQLPPIAHLHVPPPIETTGRHKKFGMIALADGSCGFFYTRFDNTLERLLACNPAQVVAKPVLEVAAGFLDSDPLTKALGLGALNALGQHLLQAGGYRLDHTTDPLGQLDLDRGRHVGMVGFFPPLVELLQQRGTALTVIEKDTQFLAEQGNFTVTLDPAHLAGCDRVLVTGSTLMNDTLDGVLACCDNNARVALIGPTAACLPDPLFERGVDVVGSSTVLNLARLRPRLEMGESWGSAVTKYCICREDYPGIHHLLAGDWAAGA